MNLIELILNYGTNFRYNGKEYADKHLSEAVGNSELEAHIKACVKDGYILDAFGEKLSAIIKDGMEV